MASPDVAPLIAKDFVYLKIDVERALGGKELHEKRIAGAAAKDGTDPKLSSGIPWFVFLDAQGTLLADSNGPKGNIGFPAQPEEIDHFTKMLQQVAVHLTADDIATIQRSLAPKPKSEAKSSPGSAY